MLWGVSHPQGSAKTACVAKSQPEIRAQPTKGVTAMGKTTLIKKTTAKAAEEIRYFVAHSNQARFVWDPKENRVLATANLNGIFCTARPHVARMLAKLGYKEVSEEIITAWGLVPPRPDITDYSRRNFKVGAIPPQGYLPAK